MDDTELLGDVDVWFDAFERGDFFVGWELQQAAIRAYFIESHTHLHETILDGPSD